MMMFGKRAYLLISLWLVLLGVAGCGSSSSDKTPSGDTLVVRSFPKGQKTYVVPKGLAQGPGGVMYLTSEDYYVGKTPLQVKLDPGEYKVVVQLEDPFDFRNDGEESQVRTLGEVVGQNAAGEDVYGVIPTAKVYAVDKQPGRPVIVTALFWPVDQSLNAFVDTLPQDTLFEVKDTQRVEAAFKEHMVPPEDREFLLLMLRQTGKAIWHAPDAKDHLYIYFATPDQLVVESSQAE
jgi:hypothetical protein